jgi:2-dehydro-3-deoxygalactonokinase
LRRFLRQIDKAGQRANFFDWRSRMTQKAEWIAVDWGNTNLRLWAMRDGRIMAERTADKGILALSGPDAFEPVLLDLAGEFLHPDRTTPVVICGAAGALGGWVMASYRALPCAPLDASAAICPPVTDPRIEVHILPGLSQKTPSAILRGEETQMAGFLAEEPDFDGVLCLPGTHTKWVHISAGEVISFMSFMTGELFELLSRHSILRLTLADSGFDEAGFLEAVSEAMSRPEKLASGLFPLRAEAILAGLDPVLARSRLSGLLIGAELAASRVHWLGRDVVVIGSPASAGPYQAALAAQGSAVRHYDGAKAVLAGLTMAHDTLR